jgi:predicted AAA+ superfamily ATPase
MDFAIIQNIMEYTPRLVDKVIKEMLDITGGVLVSGVKACGKTETAKRLAKSRVNLEFDKNSRAMAESDPALTLQGDTPRLIDEWQIVPQIFNVARHFIDERGKKGQFILTGSASPRNGTRIHSGAGRILRVKMRPMSWSELGWSDGKISLSKLLQKSSRVSSISNISYNLVDIAEKIVIGGWPVNIGLPVDKAVILNRGYVDLISEVELGEADGKYRDPVRVKKFIESYARNIATPAKMTTIVSDVAGDSAGAITTKTATEYHKGLIKIMMIEDLPVWSTHIRSSAKLRQTPKRHFVDPSLAVAALALSPESLISDLNFLGFLFESAVLMNIRIYAELIDAAVYYYRDTDGDEVDIIVEKRSGEWAVFEVKLGANMVDDGVAQIDKMLSKITAQKKRKLVSRNIIVGVGASYTRPDGVNVVSLASLGA